MKTLCFLFKDGTKIKVELEPHVYEMWLKDKETLKAIQKYGKIVHE